MDGYLARRFSSLDNLPSVGAEFASTQRDGADLLIPFCPTTDIPYLVC